MRVLKNRSGVTLLETVIVVSLLSLVILSTVMLFATMLRLWSSGSSGTSSNMYASLAIRKLILEIEEGKSAAVVNGKLVVTFPYRINSTSDYDRTQNGAVNTYYLSGATGNETSGTTLWRSSSSGKRKLARNIESVRFTTPTIKSVQIEIQGKDQVGGATIDPAQILTKVKLRNS